MTTTGTAIDPVATDTTLGTLYERRARLLNSIASTRNALDRGFFVMDGETRIAEDRAKLAETEREIEPLDALYREHRWSRFFLVMNGNGHVHSSMHCASCYPTTEYAWLPALSGSTEQTAVAEYGEKMCTVCFPSAPTMVALLGGKSRVQAEADAKRAARENKRTETAARKAEKAITNPDGSVLKGTDWRIETVHAAWRELVDLTETLDGRTYQPGSYVEAHLTEYGAARERITLALAHKLGRPADEIRAEAMKKVAKRR